MGKTIKEEKGKTLSTRPTWWVHVRCRFFWLTAGGDDETVTYHHVAGFPADVIPRTGDYIIIGAADGCDTYIVERVTLDFVSKRATCYISAGLETWCFDDTDMQLLIEELMADGEEMQAVVQGKIVTEEVGDE